MKRITKIIVCLLLTAMFVVSASAAELSATVQSDLKEANTGDVITFTVSVGELQNCKSGLVKIKYDTSVFERTENEWLLEGMALNVPDGDAVFTFQSTKTVSGNIYQFKLKVKDGVKVPTSEIQVQVELRDGASVKSTANVKVSVTIKHVHEYDNDCDTSCNICSATREPKHNYVGTVTKEPSCTEKGVKTFTCSGCKDSYTEDIAEKQHEYAVLKVINPTCAAEGKTTYQCKCGKTYSETAPKTKHNYKGEVTKEATCSEKGVKTFTCTGCKDSYTEEIAKTKHNYKGEVTKEATCSEKGVKTFTCTGCKDSYTEEIAKTKHNYKSEVTKEATCAQEGVKTVTCQACGHSYTDAIKKTDHKYEGAVTVDATCLSEGVETFTCTGCGKTYEEVLPKLEHEYDHDCDAICNLCSEVRPIEHLYSERYSSDETGHWLACTLCQEVLELIPHNPGPEATEETDQICLDCGYVICAAGTHIHEETGDWLSDDSNHWHLCSCGEIMGQEEHTWQESVRDEEEGVQIYFCTVCGHPKVEEFTPTEPSQPETEPSTSPSQPQETKPSTQPTQPDQPDDQDGFPWWIVILVIGVLLVGAVIFVIIGILRSRKQTGKYSS